MRSLDLSLEDCQSLNFGMQLIVCVHACVSECMYICMCVCVCVHYRIAGNIGSNYTWR